MLCLAHASGCRLLLAHQQRHLPNCCLQCKAAIASPEYTSWTNIITKPTDRVSIRGFGFRAVFPAYQLNTSCRWGLALNQVSRPRSILPPLVKCLPPTLPLPSFVSSARPAHPRGRAAIAIGFHGSIKPLATTDQMMTCAASIVSEPRRFQMASASGRHRSSTPRFGSQTKIYRKYPLILEMCILCCALASVKAAYQ